MKANTKLLITAATGILWMLVACSSYSEAQKLEKDVMAVHDEVMPDISRVLKLRNAIYNKLDTLNDPVLIDSFQHITANLTKADMDMMHWMHTYKQPNLESDTAIAYLHNQKEAITAVALQIKSSIIQAELALKP